MVVTAVVIAVIVVAAAAWLLSRRRADPVDSFRRQIDALSPEARRPTISQGKSADDAPDGAETRDQSGDERDDDVAGGGSTGGPDGT